RQRHRPDNSNKRPARHVTICELLRDTARSGVPQPLRARRSPLARDGRGEVSRTRSGILESSAAAAAGAAAAASADGSGAAAGGEAAEAHGAEQLDGVLVPLRASRRIA